jgi:nitroreductase
MSPLLTRRFDDALQWASELHRHQVRKATRVPYVSHLLAVAAIVLEYGGSENQAIAALLHDAIEDQDVWDNEIQRRFGDEVSALVRACTEDEDWAYGSWRGRKAAYLEHLVSADMEPEALLVSAADKLHNARSTLTDLRREGDRVWNRFHAGRDGQLWYYDNVARIFAARLPGPLAGELVDTVADLRAWPNAAGDAIGLLEGLATTRAIRRYRPDPVPEADLARMLFAASRAPSGSNRQPFRFLVLRSSPAAQEAKELLARAAKAAWSAKRAADGYDRGTGGAGDSPKARLARTMDRFVDELEHVPVVVLPCYTRYRAPTPVEGASVYPACQNLLLAARALGYGGVLTEWHALVEAELRPLLAIPDDVVIAATIPIGRPEGRHGPVRRRPLPELVYEDRWGDAAAWAVDPPGTRHTQAGPPK